MNYETNLLTIENLQSIFAQDTNLLDLRSPSEFAKGSFALTTNIPLMNDAERHQVGLCYKQEGQEKAIELGHRIVANETKNDRIAKWLSHIEKNPNGALFCFKGGLRSKITQQWIYEASGINYPRVKGGYKAMRQFLLDETQRLIKDISPIVIAGKTGSGKTIVLNQLDNSIDLEGLANHRGSSFGNKVSPQPTQINFENNLAIELIRKQHYNSIIFEDEGPNIGAIRVPIELYQKNKTADIVLLETSLENRIEMTVQEYIINMQRDYIQELGATNGFNQFCNYFINSINKIQKRLGGVLYKKLHQQTQLAFKHQEATGSIELYYDIIKVLLSDYYDPMYQYQLTKKQNRIKFQGNQTEIIEFLKY